MALDSGDLDDDADEGDSGDDLFANDSESFSPAEQSGSRRVNPLSGEKVPHLALAQLLVGIVQGEVVLSSQQRRMLISRFSEVLRDMFKMSEEAFFKGYDEGYLKGKSESDGGSET